MVDATVVVPIRNAGRHIPALLDALDRLQGPSIDIIIVNDHSTDDGPALVQAWTPAQGRELMFLESTGTGVAAARNAAVVAASGEYLWFADADDTWRPDLVERLLSAAKSGGHDIAICNASRVDEGSGSRSLLRDAGRREVASGPEVVRALLRGQVQGHLWNKLIRRELFSSVEFPATKAHSDLGGLLRLCSGARTVAFAPDVLYEYRVHAGSVLHSASYRWADLPDVLEIARHVASTLPNDMTDNRELSLFAARCVWLPLAHEAIRRRSSEADGSAETAWVEARRQLQWRHVRTLSNARFFGLAVRGCALKLSPELYARAYTSYRRKYLASLDGHLDSRTPPG